MAFLPLQVFVMPGEVAIGIGVIVGLLVLLAFFIFKDCRDFCWAVFQEKYRGMTRIILCSPTGEGIWRAETKVKGWIRAKYGNYDLKNQPVRDSSGVFYVLSRSFVWNVSVPVATAVTMLEDLGFSNVGEALNKYDNDYANKRFPSKEAFKQFVKDELSKQFEENDPSKPEEADYSKVLLRRVQIEGRQALLGFEWITPLNTALSIDYRNWCLKLDPNAQTNKNILDASINVNDAEWTKRIKEMKLGRPFMDYAVALGFVIICGVVAMYALNVMSPKCSVPTTTTMETTTTIARVVRTTVTTLSNMTK